MSSTTYPFQKRGETQVVNTEDPQSLEVNYQGLILQDQPNQQVTNYSTSLSGILYVSRPISSVGIIHQGKLTADIADIATSPLCSNGNCNVLTFLTGRLASVLDSGTL